MASSDVDVKLGFDGTQAQKDAEGALGKIGDKAASVGSTVAKTLAAGAVAGTAALVKGAVDAYAQYEQLVGGVETLFKDSADTVEAYADQAYLTAGMSANKYMDSITSFSASLIQGLGGDTAKAAEYANMAVTDMADNANKMGTAIDQITQTYQSLARGNYAMLDNLKLGYGGTKAELERLIEDANTYKEAMGGVGDLTADNFADVVEAIHIVQTEMGITGTTAKEAATTIEGSVNSMKAAWENWLTALGREDVDMSDMTDKLVDSVITALENIIPRAVKVIQSLGTTLAEKAPEIAKKLGDALADAIPDSMGPALEAITSIFTKLVVPAAGAATAMGTLKKAFNAFNSTSSSVKRSASNIYDAFLDLATSPKTASTAVGKLASVVTEFPGATALAAAGVAILVSGIVSFVDSATEAQREAETEADALEVLGDAANVASGSMTQASGSTEQLGTSIAKMHDDIQDNWQGLADLAETFDQIDQSANASIFSLQSAKQAISEYAGETDLTAQEQGLLQAAIDKVNDSCGTSYTVAKDAGGAYQVMADGATVAKGEIYDLVDAQIKQIQIEAQTSKLEELYSKQAEQAQDYAEAVTQVKDAQEAYNKALEKYGEVGSNYALDDLNEAKDNLAEVEKQLDATGQSIDAVSEGIGNMEAAASGAVEGFDALVQSSGGLNTLFAETGEDMDDFADDLESTGLSLESFSSLTETQLMEIAANWDGSTESIVKAMDDMGVYVPLAGAEAMAALNTELSEGGQEAVATAMSVSGLTAQQFADKVNQYGISGDASITAFANAIANGDTYDVAAKKAQEAANGVGSKDQAAYSEGRGLAQSAQSGMESVDTYTSGKHLGQNFAAGLGSQAGNVVKNAAALASAAASNLKFSTPKRGPWSGSEKGGYTSGMHLGQNFASGMRAARSEVEDAAVELAEAAEIRAVPVGDAVADYIHSGLGGLDGYASSSVDNSRVYSVTIGDVTTGGSDRTAQAVERFFTDLGIIQRTGAY